MRRLVFGLWAAACLASCSSFASTLAEDAGATPLDARAPDAPVGVPSEGGADASTTRFCDLPANRPSTSRFCDDFDHDPTTVDFRGWTKQETMNGLVGFDTLARSAPFSFTSRIPKDASYAQAFLRRREATGSRLHVRFDVMGAAPPKGAPLYLGHLAFDNRYDISLRAFGDGAEHLVVSETGRNADGGNTDGPDTRVDLAPSLASGKWFTIDVRVDEAAQTWTVSMEGARATKSTFVSLPAKSNLTLLLGAEAYAAAAGSIAQDTTLHYDNVIIEAER